MTVLRRERTDQELPGAVGDPVIDPETIPTPSYRTIEDVPLRREKLMSTKMTGDDEYLARHRPLEMAERRERRREEEIIKYYDAIDKLRREFPGLWKR